MPQRIKPVNLMVIALVLFFLGIREQKTKAKKIEFSFTALALIASIVLAVLAPKSDNGDSYNNNVTGDGNVIVGKVEGDFNVYPQVGTTEQTTEEEKETLVGNPDEFSVSPTIADPDLLKLIAEAKKTDTIPRQTYRQQHEDVV